MMLSQKFSKHQFISATLAVVASVAAVAAFVYAATSIGTNISVDGNLTVSGTSATSTFSTGGLTVGTSQFVVQRTSGNVGIGTTTPYAKLSLHANYGDTNQVLFAIASSTVSATTTNFIVTQFGVTGIGPDIPLLDTQYSLFVRGDIANGRSAVNILADKGASPTAFNRILQFTNEANTISYGTIVISSDTLSVNASNGIKLRLGTNGNDILFNVGGNEAIQALTISGGNGFVGIGTTTPYSKFHVTSGASATTTVNFGEVGITSSKACFNTKNVLGADISFYFNAANALVVEPNLCR